MDIGTNYFNYLLLCFVVLASIIVPSEAWSGNFCQRTRSRLIYQRYCVYRTWSGCCAWRTRLKCMYYIDYFCCQGWTHNGNGNCDIPVCSPRCFYGGTCTAPNKCSCPDGRKGDLCQDTACASYLKPCYPGWCDGDTCKCSADFQGSTCLTIKSGDYKPSIDACATNFTYYSAQKRMTIYTYTVDATNTSETQLIWTNQDNYNILNVMFNVDFDFISKYPRIPFQPDYVSKFQLGTVEGNVRLVHRKLDNTGGSLIVSTDRTYPCSGFNQDGPAFNQVMQCAVADNNYIVRMDSGDQIKFMFTAISGGFIQYINRDNGAITKQYFTGKEEMKDLEFRIDFERPKHCSESSTCPDSSYTPLTVVKDITKSTIQLKWRGWSDELSGVVRYAVEFFLLEPNLDNKLHERYPLSPVRIDEITHNPNNNNFLYEYEYIPTIPGMYSAIIEVNDRANNSQYVRRVFLFDPRSTVTINSDHDLYVSTAEQETGYKWQSKYSGTNTKIDISWPNHFRNVLHENGLLLNSVQKYPDLLDDGGRRGKGYKSVPDRFDDIDSERNISAISNVHGIVRFEMYHQHDKSGGSTFPVTPSTWHAVDNLNEEISIYIKDAITDGSTVGFWLKAYDILGNYKVDQTKVSFDMSPPQFIQQPQIENNLANLSFPFSSRVTVASQDKHSGVFKVHWKLIMNDTGFEKMAGDALNKRENCGRDCYEAANGDHFNYDISFDVNHCWMRVPKEKLDKQVMKLQLDIVNSAMLTETSVLYIDSIRNLKGIEDYFGPLNIKVTRKLSQGVSLTWKHAPSCYERDTIIIVVIMPDGSTKKLRADRNAERFDITGLEPETSYPIQLYTVYIIDDTTKETIDSQISEFVVQTKEAEGLSGGAIAGIVIGVLLLILILVGVVILLWRTGRLATLINKTKKVEESSKGGHVNLSYEKNNLKMHSTQNRKRSNVLSGSFDDTIYYGKLELDTKPWILPRSSISLESKIGSGRFATIYRAQYFTSKVDSETIAVKLIKEELVSNNNSLLLMNAKINFFGSEVGKHPNVLGFIGAVDDDTLGPFMVLEYCEEGTLKDYLTKQRNNITDNVLERLFRFVFDISKGLEYLHSKKIVHRRLAARNVLLNFLYEAKIGGFGPMSADISQDEEKSEQLPVKWLPPECIAAHSTKDATEKCDVWSFGIVMWEIFSMGETPYSEVRGRDLLKFLNDGKRMKKPEYCDAKMHGIMKVCWTEAPKKRPTMKKLKAEIEGLFTTSGDDQCYYDSKFIYDNNT